MLWQASKVSIFQFYFSYNGQIKSGSLPKKTKIETKQGIEKAPHLINRTNMHIYLFFNLDVKTYLTMGMVCL
jgi:hypothetical protein